MNTSILTAVVLVPVLALAQDTDPVVTKSAWRFGAGPSYRTGAELRLNSSSYSRASMIPNKAVGGFSGQLSNVGSTDPMDNHDYDDGYVRPDAGTVFDGNTWYWGFQDDGQIQDGALIFTAADGFDTAFSRSAETYGTLHSDEDESWGLQVQAEYCAWRKKSFGVSVLMAFSGYRFSQSNSDSSFYDRQDWSVYQRWVQDSYDLNGITAPSAPYTHGPDGPSPANPLPAPLISATPARSTYTTVTQAHTYEAFNTYQQALDLNVYVFSTGLSAEWQRDTFTLSLSAGPTLSLVESDASYEETLFGSLDNQSLDVIDSWKEDHSSSDVALGAFVQAQAGVRIPEQSVGMSLFVRQDWVDDVDGKVGQSSWEADLDGRSVGLLLTLALP